MTTTTRSHQSKLSARVWDLVGLDSAIFFTLLARGWQGVVTVTTLILIARFLSPAEQGYYYSFYSLVALQVVFELGFSFVVLQMASHERAQLTFESDGSVMGNEVSHVRLASLLHKAVRWYSVAGIMMVAFLIPAGARFFSKHSTADHSVHWLLPWCATVLVSGFTFQIDPMFSFLEGCSYIVQVARTRFLQSVLGGILAATSLCLHHGLFAPSCMILGQAIVGTGLLFSRRRLLLGLLRKQVGEYAICWSSEVWPFQWRIAVSWLSGYFMFQLFNPILFAYRGPVEAGQMGMSLTICNGLITVAYAWLSTKASPFGVMIARKEFDKLDRIFFRALTQAVAIVLLGSVTVFTIVLYMNHQHMRFAHRVVAPSTLVFLLMAVTINTVVFSEALYLRAHKQEKFVTVSVLTATLVSSSAYFLGRKYGASGMAIGYCVVNAVVGLGFGTWTFLKYRDLWHRREVVSEPALENTR